MRKLQSRLEPWLVFFILLAATGWTAFFVQLRERSVAEKATEQAREPSRSTNPTRARKKQFVLLECENGKALEQRIQALGGEVGEAIGQDTDYLVIGEGRTDPGQSKPYQRALRYGVQILSPGDLLAVTPNAEANGTARGLRSGGGGFGRRRRRP